MKFKSLNEQLTIIKRGTEEILPEEQLVKKIEKSLSTNIPLNISNKSNRHYCRKVIDQMIL